MTVGWSRPASRGRGRPRHPDVLTPTEWAVLLRVREGLSNAEIAQIRRCRVDTVKYHVANIVAKLQLGDRAALVRWDGRPLSGELQPGIDLRRMERSQQMSTAATAGTITGTAPMFLVDDVAKTAEWYRDHLGFAIGDYLREHHHDHGTSHGHDDHGRASLGVPVFVILHRDGQRLMLGRTTEHGHGVVSNKQFKHFSCDAYFWVDGVEALFALVKVSKATFVHELKQMPYGLVEFQVRDPDGRVLTFGGAPAGS